MSKPRTGITFRVRDRVGWSNKCRGLFAGPFEKDMRKQYGEGPFKVIKIHAVPKNKCTCGGLLNDEDHDGNITCPKGAEYRPLRDSVGHHQRLVLAKDGQTIMSPDGTKPVTWSGAWLQKAA